MSVMMRNGVQYAGEPTDRLDNIEEIIGDGQQSVGSDLTDAVTQLNSSLNTLLPVQKNITLGNGVIYLVKEGRHINASCSATSVSTLTTNAWTRIVNTFDFPKFSFLSINLVNGQTLTLRMDGNRSLDYYLSGTNTNVWLQGAGASVSDN